MGIKMDRRVVYTTHIIKKSFLELLSEKKLNKITVQEICKKADINRATFYAHYADIYDLMHQIESEIIQGVQAILDNYASNRDGGIMLLTKFIEENAEFYNTFLNNRENWELMDKLSDTTQESSIKRWTSEPVRMSRREAEYLHTFSAGCFLSIIKKWLSDHEKVSAEEIARMIIILLESSTQAFLEAYKERQGDGTTKCNPDD